MTFFILWNTKEDILKNVFILSMRSCFGLPYQYGEKIFVKISSFVFSRRKSVIPVLNNMSVRVNYPFKISEHNSLL